MHYFSLIWNYSIAACIECMAANISGIVSRDGYFFLDPKNQNSIFLMRVDCEENPKESFNLLL